MQALGLKWPRYYGNDGGYGCKHKMFCLSTKQKPSGFPSYYLAFFIFFQRFFLLKDNREFIRLCRNILFFRLESSNLFNYLTNMC